MCMRSVILGLGVASLAVVGKIGLDSFRKYRGLAPVKGFIKGGFESKMSRHEAVQILALNERSLSRQKIKDSHRRIMLSNHPDRGGSPFVASKVNEAKALLDADKSIRRFHTRSLQATLPYTASQSSLKPSSSLTEAIMAQVQRSRLR
ncbi:TIM23 translocase complex subunit Tim14 [Schizosaccharomyces japonicus yFS275]|uniref:Mitochondrial import inner membrane translocase subunit TIM14 n=1 Tax=Schizosaccharomyces japonicus (strain yFS275 / FY16936) TaxID=402676 RepID=B6JYD7_SCHJY|nr:TIM23 translocase complex subunit Tim14 [Schizosaccharomyces japonicus yFS275]EEB06555.1 TIM23 translocase complex subunit Tim14 [Schizosaccharomyces japonicus yFS275]